MKGFRLSMFALPASLSAVLVLAFAQYGSAQTGPRERTFPQSKGVVEKTLKNLQSSMAGHLPVLDGFARSGDHPFDRYQRAYYQSTADVTSIASGGTLVRISTKVTAWYSDPEPSRSGYQLLPSNGRLEGDLLDQLAERLAAASDMAAAVKPSLSKAAPSSRQPAATDSVSSAPVTSAPAISAPGIPDTGGTFSSSLAQSLSAEDHSEPSMPKNAGDDSSELKAEAASLEEILKNQAHPKNLVAVKKSGTAVVASPSLNAKTLFLASPHDEFEMLDFTPDWVHVRISGLSRGWIWRNNLEMPGNIPDNDSAAGPAPTPTAAELFHVSREEIAPFPGDWEPLRGKNVKIVSVQKTDESVKDGGLPVRLEFAKSVLNVNYSELAQKSPALAGIVLIFDSADGGMIAATVATLQQWKAGALSDAALWHQCFFDPPETLSSNSAGADSSINVRQ
jgi:hypothetical protein